jgi:hypothetical protein
MIMSKKASSAYDRILLYIDKERAQLDNQEEIELLSELQAFFDEEEASIRDFEDQDDGDEEE